MGYLKSFFFWTAVAIYQPVRYNCFIKWGEAKGLTAGPDGLDDIFFFFRDEDENRFIRRLLDKFQKLVGAGGVHFVRHPDDHHLIASLVSLQGKRFYDLLCLIHPDLSLLVFDANMLIPVEKAPIRVIAYKFTPVLQEIIGNRMTLDLVICSNRKGKVEIRVGQVL